MGKERPHIKTLFNSSSFGVAPCSKKILLSNLVMVSTHREVHSNRFFPAPKHN